MAVQRIRHRGEPPADRDLGPGAGRMSHQVGEGTIGLIAGIPERALDEGVAPVERRQISEAEWAAKRADSEKPRPLDPAAEAKRVEAERELVALLHRPVAPPAAPVPERPIMPASAPFDGDVAITDVELITPCDRCAHEPVCAIRLTFKPGIVQLIAIPLDEALTIQPPNVVIDCSHFLEAAAVAFNAEVALRAVIDGRASKPSTNIPETIPEPRPQRHRPGGDQDRAESVAERAVRVLAVLERHGGSTKAAGAELGMRGNVVARIAQSARARAAAPA